ncbi:MAG TPA: cupin domain-containing protein [Fimbriimonadaceae bacterium]|nr:cupin domain-containing protein [Fimbriimonadaceae bacterium]
MDAKVFSWDAVEQDHPVAKLHRRIVNGEKAMVAKVELEAGCEVATHHHEMEQIACVMSGRVLWRLGEHGTADYREVEVGGGQVVVLPSNVPHGVTAIEQTLIFDILSPPGAMGVDKQK